MAASLLGFAMVALPPRPSDWTAVVAAALLAATLVVAGAALPWQRMPAWTHPAVPLAYFVVIALLRHSQGGSDSLYAPLTLLPIFFLALFGTRRQLLVGVGGVAAVFVVPLLAVGGDAYPDSEWSRAALWTVVAGTIGLWVHDIVGRSRRHGHEARRHARELALAEERIADGISHAPIGVATAGLDGTFITVNDALVRLLGRPREELLGRQAREFSHPDDRDETLAALERMSGGLEKTHQGEKRYVRPDGEIAWANVSISLVCGTDGEPQELLCYFDDLTARKRAEEAVKASEGNLRAIGRVAQELAMAHDVRSAICDAAIEVAGGAAAYIFEPGSQRDLVLTAASGVHLPATSLPLDGTEPSVAALVYLAARRIFVEDAKRDPRAAHRLAEAIDAGSVLFEPIVGRGATIGVLVVSWNRRLETLDGRVSEVVEMLAAEAAVALERDELLRRLQEQAKQDGLTGIANRRTWDEQLGATLAASTRDGTRCCVAMLDLDHFKRFNDMHGHQAGDELLRHVARTWAAELRPGDLIARYGGEEFSVLLAGCDLPEAASVLARLTPTVPNGQTVSIGVAAWNGSETPEALTARADAALYRAKHRGRDRIEADQPRLVAVNGVTLEDSSAA